MNEIVVSIEEACQAVSTISVLRSYYGRPKSELNVIFQSSPSKARLAFGTDSISNVSAPQRPSANVMAPVLITSSNGYASKFGV